MVGGGASVAGWDAVVEVGAGFGFELGFELPVCRVGWSAAFPEEWLWPDAGLLGAPPPDVSCATKAGVCVSPPTVCAELVDGLTLTLRCSFFAAPPYSDRSRPDGHRARPHNSVYSCGICAPSAR